MSYHASILDTDLYKLTQQQAICQLYPNLRVRYDFIVRSTINFPSGFDRSLRQIVDEFKYKSLTAEEKKYLQISCPYLTPVYIDFLYGYRYDPEEVSIQRTGDILNISITGPWYRTVLWEVPLMATISQLYFEKTKQEFWGRRKRQDNNGEKVSALSQIGVRGADFGTRRRFSYEIHDEVLRDFLDHGNFLIGTSNVHLAMKHNIKPIGTIAHEFFMAHAAMYGYASANRIAMEKWVEVYKGNLGIILPDTFTTDVFLRDFNTLYAKLYDGGRQDSGNPFNFAEKWIRHYEKLGIDPASKTIVFSDSINNIKLVNDLHQLCKDRIKDSYGIGTWLSNDVGVKPLNMVIKLTGVEINGNWTPTVKLSDDPGKHTGSPQEVDLCEKVLRLVS